MVDRAQIAAALYAELASRWPGRFDGVELADDVSLGSDGLGLDSIEIVELMLDLQDGLDGYGDPTALLDSDEISIGGLVDYLARW
jgi:acyl carrier protein